MKILNNLIYFFANVDSKVIGNYTKGVRVNRQIIGISILLAGIFSTISVAYFLGNVYYQNQYRQVIVILGAIFFFCLITNMDRGLFLAKSKSSVLIRAVLVLVLTLFTAIPFKLTLLGSKADSEIINRYQKGNNERYTEIVGKIDAEYKMKKDEIDRELKKQKREKHKLDRLAKGEKDGYAFNSSNSGKKGEGIEHDKFKNQLKIVEKWIEELEYQKEELTNKYTYERSLAESKLNNATPVLDQSFVSKLIIFKKMLLTPDDEERLTYKQFNIGIQVIFLIFELLPVFMKLVFTSKHDPYEMFIQRVREIENECESVKAECFKQIVDRQRVRISGKIPATDEELQEVLKDVNNIIYDLRESYFKPASIKK